ALWFRRRRRIEKVFGSFLVKIGNHMGGRCRSRDYLFENDVSRLDLLAIESFVGAVVGPNRRTGERDTRKQTARAGISQDFGAKRHVRGRFCSATFETSCGRGVAP